MEIGVTTFVETTPDVETGKVVAMLSGYVKLWRKSY